MKTIHAFKKGEIWSYVDNAKDIPAELSVSFQQDFDSLTADEETYFCTEVLTFNESEKTVTFSREKFNSDIRNVIYMDMETNVAKQADWLERRIAAYPSIGDQMDMIYKDQINSTTTWSDAVAAAKLATPKVS
tara:strand:+ start:520 stop:918 length:399 start_codon:yes stop_codon:yes gene_type:complete